MAHDQNLVKTLLLTNKQCLLLFIFDIEHDGLPITNTNDRQRKLNPYI